MSQEWTSESSDSEDDVIIESDDESIDEQLPPTPQVSKEEVVVKRGRGRPRKPKPEKPPGKRQMSEKQLAALANGRAKRDAGRLERRTAKQKETEAKKAVQKKRREEMLVKKAIKIKKKEAIEEAELILSSEDDMDELEVKQVKRLVAKRKTAKKKTAPKQVVKDTPKQVTKDTPVKPQFIFY